MNEGEKQKLIVELKDFYKELKSYKKQLDTEEELSEPQKRYRESLRERLIRKVGTLKTVVIGLTGKEYITRLGQTFDMWEVGLTSHRISGICNVALDYCIDAANEAIGKLETAPLSELEPQGGVSVKEPPKAFIAHEGETPALISLKEFLEALGVKYFIAESEASGGKSIEKHVNWVEEQGDFAIILATKGKALDKQTGRYYMGLNVADELGTARQIYGNHIILLVQKGVQVHTNKREIVYGEFTSTNMQEAFIKIARELRNWGFIK
jgi:hypothetical protein